MRAPFSGSRDGFTLIEILTVLAVIAVLAGIVLWVRDGVRQRSALSLAESEMAVLRTALEQYRAAYGDYPMVPAGEGATVLYGALTLTTAPAGGLFDRTQVGAPLVALERFQIIALPSLAPTAPEPGALGGAGTPLADTNWSAHAFADPWGQPYHYGYRAAPGDPAWQRRGYILLSTGPSGATATEEGRVEDPDLPSTGLFPPTYRDGADTYDNLFDPP